MKMNRLQKIALVGMGLALGLAGGAWADESPIGDATEYYFEEHTFTDTTVSRTGSYYIGYSGSFNVLTIGDNATFTYTPGGSGMIVGFTDGGDDNKLVVESGGTLNVTGTAWNSIIRLGGYGANGTGNRNELVVDGGTVTTNIIRVGDGIGNSTDFCDGNTIRVRNGGTLTTSDIILLGARSYAQNSGLEITGANSSVTIGSYFSVSHETNTGEDWVTVDAGTLTVEDYVLLGRSGSNNTFEITNNGTVDVGSYLNLGNNSTSHNNTLTVNNGTLTTGTYLMVGRMGNENEMTVTNGGEVEIGTYMMVGMNGSETILTVSDNATVSVGTNLHVGRNSTSHENEVNVNNATLTIGDTLYVGNVGTNNTLTVTGADSNVTVYGDNIGGEIIIGNTGANNTIEVGAGAELEAGRFFIVGSGSSDNTLRVNNANVTIGTDPGEDMTLKSLRIGAGSAAHRNVVELTGAEALLSMSGFSWVGGFGSENTLDIRNGANMTLTGSVIIGRYDGSEDNTVTVDGADGTTRSYLNPGVVEVGGSGGNNTMIVSGGALVETGTTYIGRNETSGGNLLHVTGADSEFINSGTIFLSPEGTIENVIRVDQDGYLQGSTLEVGANGTVEVKSGGEIATVTAFDVESGIGANYDSEDPESERHVGLTVTGATSKVTVGTAEVEGNFRVGNTTPDNTVEVLDGGHLGLTGILSIGVGNSADRNILRIENGTLAVGNYTRLGNNAPSTGNVLEVTGKDAVVTMGNFVWLGANGSDNSIEVLDGASLTVAGVWVGRYTGSEDNVLLVDGKDGDDRSTVATTYLNVGGSGANNTAIVSGGAQLTSSTNLSVGRFANATLNTLTITGAGSELNANNVIVGESGSTYNTVEVADGGSFTVSGSFAVGETGTHNTVEVTGGGSLAVSGNAFVSQSDGSHDNTLRIQGAGSSATFDTYLLVGGSDNIASNNNLLEVDGAGASLEVDGVIFVGTNGVDNRFRVVNGATAQGSVLRIGRNASSSNNTMLVDASTYTDSSYISVGVDGSGNAMTVSGGGEVAIAGNAHIGHGSTVLSTDNILRVTGADSRFSSLQNVIVSSNGSNNTLQIDAGGLVLAGDSLDVRSGGQVDVNAATAGVADTLIVAAGGNLTLGGNAVVHVGAGYDTVVNEDDGNSLWVASGGTLLANGAVNLGAGGALNVQAAGTVAGAGTIVGDSDVYGILSPGNSAGTLEFTGGLTLHDTGEVHIQLGDGENDLIKADSILVEGGTLYFSLIEGYTPVPGTYIIFETNAMGDTLVGAFDAYNTDALPSGWTVNTDDLYAMGQITIIPEPHTMGLILLGLGAVALRRRVKTRNQ